MTVELELPKALRDAHLVFHFSLLKKELGNGTLGPEKAVQPVIVVDEEQYHEVAEILVSKLKHNVLFYLTTWKDIPESDNDGSVS